VETDPPHRQLKELGICCSNLIGTASTITTYLPFWLSVPSTNPNESAVTFAAIDSHSHSFFHVIKKTIISFKEKKKIVHPVGDRKYSWLQLIKHFYFRGNGCCIFN